MKRNDEKATKTKDEKCEEYCCDMRGMLSFLVLFLLSKKSMHGQEISDELEKRKGVRPSPGTIYPALKSLKNAGLVIEKKKGKNIFYSLSTDGKIVLGRAKEKFARAFMDIF